MNDHLKLFVNHSTYSTAESLLIKPNISLCIQENEIHYNPILYICKLTLRDGSVVNIEGSGELTTTMINDYKTSIVNVEINKSCTSIGDNAFYGCSNLTSVTIPNSVTNIGEDAFRNCSGLTSVIIPNSVTCIRMNAFNNCRSLTSVTIPNSVTNISSSAFYNCANLANVIIPNSVTYIGNYAFYGCVNLTNIVIPNNITEINRGVFQSCSGLTSVTIPNSVTNIREIAFYECKSLSNIISLATTAPTVQYDTFEFVKTGGILTVPTGSTGYDTWMSTGNNYLGKYNWTKVEQ